MILVIGAFTVEQTNIDMQTFMETLESYWTVSLQVQDFALYGGCCCQY